MGRYEDIDLNFLESIKVKIQRGIYFLYRGEELVYIGQTTNLFGRLYGHLHANIKEFDSYKFLEVDGNISLTNIEISLVEKFRPFYNIHYKRDTLKETQLKSKEEYLKLTGIDFPDILKDK